MVLDALPRRVGKTDHQASLVVFPSTGFAGAVGIFHELASVVVFELFLVAVCILNNDHQPAVRLQPGDGARRPADPCREGALVQVVEYA